jgi:hypothetical protein
MRSRPRNSGTRRQASGEAKRYQPPNGSVPPRTGRSGCPTAWNGPSWRRAGNATAKAKRESWHLATSRAGRARHFPYTDAGRLRILPAGSAILGHVGQYAVNRTWLNGRIASTRWTPACLETSAYWSDMTRALWPGVSLMTVYARRVSPPASAICPLPPCLPWCGRGSVAVLHLQGLCIVCLA